MSVESDMALDRKSNFHLVGLVLTLKRAAHEHQAAIWRDLAKRLEKPARSWPVINLSRLERNLDPKATAVVPGKVLGAGDLSKPLTVAAWSFSASARHKITEAGGKCLTLNELLENNPSGSNISLMG